MGNASNFRTQNIVCLASFSVVLREIDKSCGEYYADLQLLKFCASEDVSIHHESRLCCSAIFCVDFDEWDLIRDYLDPLAASVCPCDKGRSYSDQFASVGGCAHVAVMRITQGMSPCMGVEACFQVH